MRHAVTVSSSLHHTHYAFNNTSGRLSASELCIFSLKISVLLQEFSVSLRSYERKVVAVLQQPCITMLVSTCDKYIKLTSTYAGALSAGRAGGNQSLGGLLRFSVTNQCRDGQPASAANLSYFNMTFHQ